jgi:hypothetical protein
MENKTSNINRRDLLKNLALITGYTFTAGATSAFLAGCKTDVKNETTTSTLSSKFLTADEHALLAEVTERIIPKTDTPGAKDAGVADYIDMALKGFYKPEDQTKFREGIKLFDKTANEKYKKNFVQLTDENKDDVLKILADEWKKKENEPHIFKEVRDLTVTGYCTSEQGATKFLVYDPIPGPYQADIDRKSVAGCYAY